MAQSPSGRSDSWWVISDEAFNAALRRAHAGEDPELILIEHYANSDSTGDPS